MKLYIVYETFILSALGEKLTQPSFPFMKLYINIEVYGFYIHNLFYEISNVLKTLLQLSCNINLIVKWNFVRLKIQGCI